MCIRDRKKIRKPKEEWWRVEDTHEAIISKEDFDRVQKQIASRRRKQKDGTTQIFAGLVKCADCGWSLAYATNQRKKAPYSYYHCSKNGQGLRPVSYTHLDVYKRQFLYRAYA